MAELRKVEARTGLPLAGHVREPGEPVAARRGVAALAQRPAVEVPGCAITLRRGLMEQLRTIGVTGRKQQRQLGHRAVFAALRRVEQVVPRRIPIARPLEIRHRQRRAHRQTDRIAVDHREVEQRAGLGWLDRAAIADQSPDRGEHGAWG